VPLAIARDLESLAGGLALRLAGGSRKAGPNPATPDPSSRWNFIQMTTVANRSARARRPGPNTAGSLMAVRLGHNPSRTPRRRNPWCCASPRRLARSLAVFRRRSGRHVVGAEAGGGGCHVVVGLGGIGEDLADGVQVAEAEFLVAAIETQTAT
jgi:hypothetical protein